MLDYESLGQKERLDNISRVLEKAKFIRHDTYGSGRYEALVFKTESGNEVSIGISYDPVCKDAWFTIDKV